MKKTILMLFVLGFVAMNGYAQQVYKKESKVYLECTVASGMPAGSVTTTPKCKEGTASNNTYRNGATDNNIYASENDKVFEKLEIDASDMTKPGESTTYTMDWKTAYDVCKSKNAGWRLPTQRELILMNIFRVQLGYLTGNEFVSVSYWSSSEYSATRSLYVGFGLGFMMNYGKSNSFRVRCVREVTP